MTGAVLVTGASGFIGTRLCRRLLRRGVDVHATHRSPLPADVPPEATWHRVDLADGDAVGDLVRRVEPEVVVHLASHVAGGRGPDLLRATFEGNLASTVHLLEALARAEKGRLVLTGSLEEGEPGSVPSSPYAAAKAAAASYARMALDLWGIPIAHVRLFMVYGPGQRDVRKLVPYTVLEALRGRSPRISSGTREVDWVYVDDVVDGLARLLDVPEAFDAVPIDLGSGKLRTVREVVETILRQVDPALEPEIGAVADRAREQVRRADVRATGRRLGWRPGVELEEGVARTIEAYRNGAAVLDP